MKPLLDQRPHDTSCGGAKFGIPLCSLGACKHVCMTASPNSRNLLTNTSTITLSSELHMALCRGGCWPALHGDTCLNQCCAQKAVAPGTGCPGAAGLQGDEPHLAPRRGARAIRTLVSAIETVCRVGREASLMLCLWLCLCLRLRLRLRLCLRLRLWLRLCLRLCLWFRQRLFLAENWRALARSAATCCTKCGVLVLVAPHLSTAITDRYTHHRLPERRCRRRTCGGRHHNRRCCDSCC